MKWFRHFTNARDSKDLTKVRIKYGADGYAIYWYCLEVIGGDLGQDENITFELKHDSEVIGHNLKIDSSRVEEIMRYMVSIGLFERVDNTITCLKIAKYLDKKLTRNNSIHGIIDKFVASGTVRDSSPTFPDVSGRSPLDIDIDIDIKHMSNPDGFDEFWSAYPRKADKKKAAKTWGRMTKANRALALADAPVRYANTELQYIPLPTTYLNGERWNDEKEKQPSSVDAYVI